MGQSHHASSGHEAGSESGDVDTRIFAAERSLTAAERIARIGRLNEALRDLALQDLRVQHPEASERELRLRLAVRQFGAEVVERVWGWREDVGNSSERK